MPCIGFPSKRYVLLSVSMKTECKALLLVSVCILSPPLTSASLAAFLAVKMSIQELRARRRSIRNLQETAFVFPISKGLICCTTFRLFGRYTPVKYHLTSSILKSSY